MRNTINLTIMIYLIFIAIAVASYAVQSSLKSKFERYSKIPIGYGMSGRDVAAKMLYDNGIKDVAVRSTSGMLSDYFNPQDKTVNLSDGVYAVNSVAAAAVAAHECGHVVQHAVGYGPLRLRSALVPVVSFASQWVSWILLAGILPAILGIGVLLFALTTLFSFVTLPVEIDASRRAIEWLDRSGLTQGQTTEYARDALRAAAYTYVVAALGSLATLVYYLLVLLNRRD